VDVDLASAFLCVRIWRVDRLPPRAEEFDGGIVHSNPNGSAATGYRMRGFRMAPVPGKRSMRHAREDFDAEFVALTQRSYTAQGIGHRR